MFSNKFNVEKEFFICLPETGGMGCWYAGWLFCGGGGIFGCGGAIDIGWEFGAIRKKYFEFRLKHSKHLTLWKGFF